MAHLAKVLSSEVRPELEVVVNGSPCAKVLSSRVRPELEVAVTLESTWIQLQNIYVRTMVNESN